MNKSLLEHQMSYESFKDKNGIGNTPFEEIEPEFLNPYAIGHKINHPPPDISENVWFIDFDIPYTWFPSEYLRHLPYIDNSQPTFAEQSSIRKNVLRTVAVVAARFIENGEELYTNYYEDDRVPPGFSADWLVRPPPLSPYLTKKKMITQLPISAKILIHLKFAKLGEKFDTWESRSFKEISPSEGKFYKESLLIYSCL